MGSFSTGGNILSSKCRFLSLTFLSDWQTKLISAGKESLIFMYLWLIIWKGIASQPPSKGMLAQENIFFQLHRLIVPLSLEKTILSELSSKYLFYSSSDIWEQLWTPSCAIKFLDERLKELGFMQCLQSLQTHAIFVCLGSEWTFFSWDQGSSLPTLAVKTGFSNFKLRSVAFKYHCLLLWSNAVLESLLSNRTPGVLSLHSSSGV